MEKLTLGGLLTPRWLTKEEHTDTPVWLYSEQTGPYLIEFGDGRLVMVYRD